MKEGLDDDGTKLMLNKEKYNRYSVLVEKIITTKVFVFKNPYT